MVFAAGLVWERGFTAFHISLPFSFGGGGVSVSNWAGSSAVVVVFSGVLAGFSTNVTCFLA